MPKHEKNTQIELNTVAVVDDDEDVSDVLAALLEFSSHHAKSSPLARNFYGLPCSTSCLSGRGPENAWDDGT